MNYQNQDAWDNAEPMTIKEYDLNDLIQEATEMAIEVSMDVEGFDYETASRDWENILELIPEELESYLKEILTEQIRLGEIAEWKAEEMMEQYKRESRKKKESSRKKIS